MSIELCGRVLTWSGTYENSPTQKTTRPHNADQGRGTFQPGEGYIPASGGVHSNWYILTKYSQSVRCSIQQSMRLPAGQIVHGSWSKHLQWMVKLSGPGAGVTAVVTDCLVKSDGS